ncbi:MAG TPA: DUF2520 domain-containing protein [Thermoanaerobaculia bacterium]|jgi:predicted short-subunit dehydrogenase-like oxidoreductase (DUF2520 family)|nr:DUF2520 domain-containing protein [Thermoanaerobaculia bacterium]
MRLGILGGGRAAWAFGSAWKRIGWPLSGVWLRDESHSHIAELLGTARLDLADLAHDSELLLVAVSDRAIAEVAQTIPAATEALVFHASGALLSMRDGFSLHPLQSLPPVGTPSDLEGTLLVFEGQHRRTAKLIAAAVGARFCEVAPEQKPLYHAAAVFGANYVAAALDIAERLMSQAGVTGTREDLVALAHSAIANWRAHEDARRFTGPAARGDRDVLTRHLEALHDDPQVAQIYTLLADQIAGALLARQK